MTTQKRRTAYIIVAIAIIAWLLSGYKTIPVKACQQTGMMNGQTTTFNYC